MGFIAGVLSDLARLSPSSYNLSSRLGAALAYRVIEQWNATAGARWLHVSSGRDLGPTILLTKASHFPWDSFTIPEEGLVRARPRSPLELGVLNPPAFNGAPTREVEPFSHQGEPYIFGLEPARLGPPWLSRT